MCALEYTGIELAFGSVRKSTCELFCMCVKLAAKQGLIRSFFTSSSSLLTRSIGQRLTEAIGQSNSTCVVPLQIHKDYLIFSVASLLSKAIDCDFCCSLESKIKLRSQLCWHSDIILNPLMMINVC